MKKKYISLTIIMLVAAIICTIASIEFLKMHQPDSFYPSTALTKEGTLSDYFAGLKGTSNDTRIFFFEGENPGATVLLLGGTHPNEPASSVAATLVLENITVSHGRVIVIPQACLSGFTCTDPFEGYPQFFHLITKSGNRRFRFGSRVANPLDQWPDPLVYSHHPSGQKLSGFETRNLNRSYPGRPDGSFSEQIAYAIMQLIKTEKVNLAFDLHEAAPEIPIINAIVYHEKGEDIAMSAVLGLELEDLNYAPELSPVNFRGLSHREWGDNTDAIPFLMETSNPIQGRLRGRTNAELVVTGNSPRYKEALESGALRIEYLPTGEPIELRVGRHVMGFKIIIEAFNEFNEDNKIEINGLPDYAEITKKGVGAFLH